ncbi:1-phosphatidylinositol-4-phosphate 5-kinase [Sugiyamaella lignohabitans]|uniref:1-phosphatidylinositol-4-phosphate 5-kinase n=1 Tax=Sugiyamaella lignohabitans TaxID=796027 RepID=A0A161HLR3_9ASCO|nr:1-phosphatidylinositol-4-phosphate 5-kinase [Sugiyamaella lignohabitans]ANB14377.1 1-phosphatidylinositol-4-phosphate 5-kinase [Sugiyamaella lignohabitans]
MLAASSPSVTQLQLPFSYQRHSNEAFESEKSRQHSSGTSTSTDTSGGASVSGSDDEHKLNSKLSIVTNGGTLVADNEHQSSDDIDDAFLSHNSLSARSMSSLATTVDSRDYEKSISTNIAVHSAPLDGQMTSSASSINGLSTTFLPVGDFHVDGPVNGTDDVSSLDNNTVEIETDGTRGFDNDDASYARGQRFGSDTFYDAPNSNNTSSSLTADSLLTVTDNADHREQPASQPHESSQLASYKGLRVSTKGDLPTLSCAPEVVANELSTVNSEERSVNEKPSENGNSIEHEGSTAHGEFLTAPTMDSAEATSGTTSTTSTSSTPTSISNSSTATSDSSVTTPVVSATPLPFTPPQPNYHSPKSQSASTFTPTSTSVSKPARNDSSSNSGPNQSPLTTQASNARTSSTSSVATANVLANSSSTSPVPRQMPTFRGSLPGIESSPQLLDPIPSHVRTSIGSTPPSPNVRTSVGSAFSFDDQRYLSRASTGSHHSIASPTSPVSAQQLASLRSPNPSASSSSSLPSMVRERVSNAGSVAVPNVNSTGAVAMTGSTIATANIAPTTLMGPPQLPTRALSQQIVSTSNQSNNRNSLSSQRSAASSQEVPSIRRLSLYSHRNSFSFSRRRSIAGPPIPSNGQELDRSATVIEIERLREEIIVQRELRRRRREFLEDERVLMGTKVSEGHVNYVTAYNMLTGIRVSVSRCNGKVDRPLNDEDFVAKNKLAFDVSGNELTPSARYDFKFKDYAPWVFRHLRELFKLDPADYLMSLTSKYIVSELGSPGKSGSFFYFSRDYRFIIKTIHHSEHKMLRKILKDYYNHVKNNPNTLISQFYGLHRVKLPFGRKIHFIVMNNLFPPHRDIHRTYDLKGSTQGRRLQPQDSKKAVVYKDLNWIDAGESIMLGPTKKRQFLDQLEIDVALLKRLNIMDYSLLIGIHDLTKGNTENIRDNTLQVFEPGSATISQTKVNELRKALTTASPTALAQLDLVLNQYERNDFIFYADSGGFRATNENNEPLNDIYYLGIIDCLTPYTFTKRVETFFKGLSNAHVTISAIPALEYGDRFFKFIKSVVVSKREGQQNVIGEETAPSAIEVHLPVLSEASTEARSVN